MSLLIYGANGYTGRLIVPVAVARGLSPILSGRDATAVNALATEHGLEARPASLDNAAALDDALRGITVVLHCAGPFSRTSKPMVDACLRAGAHYLDITGEVEIFEACATRDVEAKSRGVMLLPGTGFDVVPSDCLASHLARRLPDATSLALGFRSLGGLSRGTALTMAEGLGKPGVIRRAGRITPVPPGFHTRTIDFGDGPRLAVTIPWGDVSTAFHSTGIPDVRVYMSIHPKQLRSLKIAKWFGFFLQTPWMQEKLSARIKSGKPGPSDAARARGGSLLWGEATNAAGRTVVSRLRGPDGYSLTADTAVRCAMRALRGDAPVGFQTPSRAYGTDFIMECDGMTREDVA
ncbi:MAG TPA: saccharopine dehydrogenase NADP-binding domain-containing protein [Gemmatimonas sp.]|nr:saccharopine dehydrogenase NADP-binding domain-containing protein [Gemmatimonas sp.]